MWIAALRLRFRLRQARSLKDKRRVSSRIRERTRARFHVAICEVEAADDLRTLVIGIATVGDDPRVLRSVLDRIVAFIEGLYLAEITRREVEIRPMDPTPTWPEL